MRKVFIALVFAPFFFIAPAHSASQDECAAWICLPGGFPSGCEAARSAMRDRVKDGKPPLPDFAACATNPPAGSGSHMSYLFGHAAFIPGHRVCTRSGRWRCLAWEVLPDRYVKGERCHRDGDGDAYPSGCTRTVRWAEVYVDDALIGTTYYW